MDSTIAEQLGPDDPREIGSFNIIGLLGTGGMGEVYLGASDKGYAAVKRVRPRLVSSERFEREVGILYRVPVGVGPRVLASDGTAERPWFAAEYIPGLTVDEAVRLRGTLPVEALWLLLAEAAAQLRAVHALDIVHRDVKPGNVMLVRDGVRLIDFGIARAADQTRLTRGGGGYGTQGFSAPEQQTGDEDVDAPADVYALGALLLYAASGRTPGAVPDVEPLRAVDASLAAVVGSCLTAAPEARPTAGEVVEAVRAHPSVPPPSWPSEVMSRIASRRAFATTPVGKLETVPPPNLAAGPPDAADPPGSTEAGTLPTIPVLPRRPRRRLLLAVVVLAVAAGAAFLLIPSGPSQKGTAHSPGRSPATVEPVAGTTRASSANPSRPASPTAESAPPTLTLTPGVPVGTHTTAPPDGAPTKPSAPAITASTAVAARPTARQIAGISGNEDPDQVKGSEADTSWVGNDAACSAWLDDNGSGELAGVLNTSLSQTCNAMLYRSDGVAYGFHASWGAAKTNFVSDVGTTMWICVWNANDASGTQCSARFAMHGHTPVEE